MKIAIEAQRLFRTNKHGMDFVVLEQIKQLQKIDTTNEYYILVAPGDDKCVQESSNVKIIEIACPSYPLWEQWALPRQIKQLKPDLLHCTSNTAPISCNVPLVLTLHDIIYLEKSQQKSKSSYQQLGRLYRRLVVPRILPHCEKIITVSHFECNRIAQALSLPSDKITVLYNACSERFFHREKSDEIVKKYNLPERYYFFLGNTDPKKNTDNLLKAYAECLKKYPELPTLVIADLSPVYMDQLLTELNLLHLKEHIRLTEYINNSDLPFIYSQAELFLYPSLRESFGIPILEAMSCEVPVLTSNTSAMPEIAGEAALFVDPFSVDSITQGILKLHEQPDYRQEFITKGLERVKKFSWGINASQLLDIYREVYKKN